MERMSQNTPEPLQHNCQRRCKLGPGSVDCQFIDSVSNQVPKRATFERFPPQKVHTCVHTWRVSTRVAMERLGSTKVPCRHARAGDHWGRGLLPKLNVVGSSPISRSNQSRHFWHRAALRFLTVARCPGSLEGRE